MNSKAPIWIGMSIGSVIGGVVPMLWGASLTSLSSVLFTAIGGIAGIWLGYKISNY